ncbi:hypothetical protein NF865_07900 [Thermococcus aggregans]|uniref:Uncharacterized protein n=1 Tax=Thermococcus aggregans TaxID=110163 RepID=A0A9E7MWJ6_THEAG|nr:hypothetical protein [Thermococcus aggregans]USS40244.1 hypothetical protein NF865_07900 [Thermococcus aggregans]
MGSTFRDFVPIFGVNFLYGMLARVITATISRVSRDLLMLALVIGYVIIFTFFLQRSRDKSLKNDAILGLISMLGALLGWAITSLIVSIGG